MATKPVTPTAPVTPTKATGDNATPKKAKKAPAAPRPVKHTEFAHEDKFGDDPMRVELAMALIGWESEEQYKARILARNKDITPTALELNDNIPKLSPDGEMIYPVIITDINQKKACLWNNSKNRPFRPDGAKKYAQTILRKEWAGPNGTGAKTPSPEPIAIGEYGNVLSGAHRCVGLIFAHQIWEINKERYHHIWPEGPVMDTVIFYGVDESPALVRTLDDVQPRTFADVLYTEDFFTGSTPRDRIVLTRALEVAISFLWERTGAEKHGGTTGSAKTFLTHGAADQFVRAHPHLIQAVSHVFQENKAGKGKLQEKKDENLSRFISLGNAAGLLYLMGAMNTDPDDYAAADPRSEGTKRTPLLDWSLWDRACEFWSLVSQDTPLSAVLRKVQRPYSGEGSGYIFAKGGESGTIQERAAYLIAAWHAFVANPEGIVTDKDLDFKEFYRPVDDDGIVVYRLYNHPAVRTEDKHGIDFNPPTIKVKKKEGNLSPDTAGPSGEGDAVLSQSTQEMAAIVKRDEFLRMLKSEDPNDERLPEELRGLPMVVGDELPAELDDEVEDDQDDNGPTDEELGDKDSDEDEDEDVLADFDDEEEEPAPRMVKPKGAGKK